MTMPEPAHNNPEAIRRWRLILGRYAENSLSRDQFGVGDAELDQVLGYLYDREYTERGHRHQRGAGGSGDPSSLTAINWLEKTRKLFPRSTFERLQNQAVARYGLTELLADTDTAATMTPSPELGTALLRVRGKLSAELEAGLRLVISRVVDEIVARIKVRFTAAISGRRDRQRRSFQLVSQNFDWRRTIRANLAHYDMENKRLLIDQARFNSRVRKRLPWEIILCVDQSVSMADSILYSAVCASILAGLPGIDVRLILFDTSIVDLTRLANDPVTVLMTAQLGGGTDIAGAVRYCEQQIRTPRRTILALISDFEEGGSVSDLLASITRLKESGVTLLGLAALDEQAQAVYDHYVGGKLAERGMSIAALTPDHFAEWLAEVMG